MRCSVVTIAKVGALSTAASWCLGNPSSLQNILLANSGIFTGPVFGVAAPTVATQQNITGYNAASVVGEGVNAGITIAATGTGGFSWRVKVVIYGAYVTI